MLVFNYPILEKIVDRFKKSVANDAKRQEAVISYDIDEYDERFLRHLALGYTKEMIASLKGMPFGVSRLSKSIIRNSNARTARRVAFTPTRSPLGKRRPIRSFCRFSNDFTPKGIPFRLAIISFVYPKAR